LFTEDQEDVVITLDCAQADFLSHDKVILSLKGGELYSLTLLLDAMTSVRGFHFDKAASSVLTSCVSISLLKSRLRWSSKSAIFGKLISDAYL